MNAVVVTVAWIAAGINLARTSYLPRTDFLAQVNRATHNNVFGMMLQPTVLSPISGPVLQTNSLESVWGTGVGIILFIIWANFLITAWSNAVNLTDGLDGLASGAAIIFFASYVLVGIWQTNQLCGVTNSDLATCYDVRDPRDLAILAAAIAGACFGFLWWNASPAKIFMGDTGSLALGGAIAGLTIVSRTEILGAIIGGLFVIIVMSSVLQISFFKITKGKRIFKMAPLHHHFELLGWGEVTIVTRFWIIAGLFAAVGMGVFYAEWVSSLGPGG